MLNRVFLAAHILACFAGGWVILQHVHGGWAVFFAYYPACAGMSRALDLCREEWRS